MEIESSLVAAQNGLTINPTLREPQSHTQAREQREHRQQTTLPASQVVTRQAQPEAYAQAERFRQQQLDSEQGNFGKSQQAISAYTRMSNEHQRQQIQQLFGIDTYA